MQIQRAEAVHSALKRGCTSRFRLVDLVEFLTEYREMHEIKNEIKSCKRALLQAYSDVKLPSVAALERKKIISPYAVDVLRAQAAEATGYEMAEALPGPSAELSTYIVARQGGGAKSRAAAFREAHDAAVGQGADEKTALAIATAAAAAARAAPASIPCPEVTAPAEGDPAVELNLQAEDCSSWRLTSLRRCSCQFQRHKGCAQAQRLSFDVERYSPLVLPSAPACQRAMQAQLMCSPTPTRLVHRSR